MEVILLRKTHLHQERCTSLFAKMRTSLFANCSTFLFAKKRTLLFAVYNPMVIDKIELENVKTISENNRKITRFSYKIPLSTIMEIKKADQISIRYYSGPSMITVKPKNLSIKKIKELIDTE